MLDVTAAANTFNNEGLIKPGDGGATGILTINGATSLDARSELQFELGGTTAGTQYDVLNFIGGGTTLGGRLRVDYNAFTPLVGATFAILTSTVFADDFAEIEGLDFSSTVVLDFQQSASAIVLVAVSVDISGTVGDDTLNATGASEFIAADLGDDTILGVSTGDTVFGQGGDDVIEADSGFYRIDGGDGIDTLVLAETLDYTTTFVPAHYIDHIEILSLKGNGMQTIQLDAAAIAQIVDGYNSYTGVDNDLFIVGDEGDLVQLNGFFEVGVSSYLDPQGNGLGERFSMVELTSSDTALFVDQSVRLDVTRADSSFIQFGGSGDETLTGSALGDYLDGRLGIDTVDGGGGDDSLVYDGLDTLIDGGLGLDSLLITDSINLTGLDNLDGFEVLDLSNGHFNEISLDIDDLLNWVTDNELEAIGAPGIMDGLPKLAITGDEYDQVFLNGQDLLHISNQTLMGGVTSTFAVINDPFNDGNDYISFYNSTANAHLLVNALLVDPNPFSL